MHMHRSLPAAAAAGFLLLAACGSSKNNFPSVPLLRPSPGPGTAVPTTALGTPGPGATPRGTASAAAFPTGNGIPTPPAGAAAVQSLPDGLQYQDFVVGSGPTAQAGQTVTVRYTGWLDNGTKFDSSADHSPGTFNFKLGQGQVIKGWDEGVAGMKAGGTRLLIIPPALGYGSQQAGTIPPNSRLTFLVQLVSVQ